ncbi:hypothetical protein [Maribacter sp. R77961]|uniref:hypothetical protein n=1 Tax=Maribacter sp. R77961 TaxID=3093871 RepID=UPI0037C5F570
MRTRNINIIIASLMMTTGVALAQDNPTEALETVQSKTYTVNNGKEMVKRTVEISTMQNTAVRLDKEDSTKIDQSRVIDGIAKITKTVKIDNDADDAFDEKIVFTYNSDMPEDFVLISNKNELAVAIDQGENLKIVENMSLKSKNEFADKQTYIFTDNNGKEIEFMVEEYTKNAMKMSDSK